MLGNSGLARNQIICVTRHDINTVAAVKLRVKRMNTIFLLMAEFETSTIPLAVVAERYLGMKPATADKKAGCGDLPLPTFRIGDSQKSPRMVHVSDLADFIDIKRKEAKQELKRMQ